MNVVDELLRLQALRESKVLSDEEFTVLKERVIEQRIQGLPEGTGTGMSIEDELKSVKKVRGSGILSDAEFAALLERIIAERKARELFIEGKVRERLLAHGWNGDIPSSITKPPVMEPVVDADDQLPPQVVRNSLFPAIFCSLIGLIFVLAPLYPPLIVGFEKGVGNATLALFLVFTCPGLFMLFVAVPGLARGDRMVLDREGIRGPRVGDQPLAWSQIEGVRYYEKGFYNKLTLELGGGNCVVIRDYLALKPDCETLYHLIGNRIETGRFQYPKN